MGNCWKEIQPE